MRRTLTRGVFAVVLAAVVGVQGATVAIDASTEYQTILGFGGSAINGSASDLVNDMGLSVSRIVIEPTAQPIPSYSILTQLKDLGVRTFIGVPWSPPANMKDNNSTINGGSLLPQYYSAFGNHLGGFITDFKSQVGIDLYAFSPQNEPRFPEPYNSCVYTPETYRDMVKVVGATLRNKGITTPMFIAEDMLTAFTVSPMIQYSVADAQARQYIGALSVHGYADGVNPIPEAEAAQAWGGTRGISKYGAAQGLPVWQTEMSGFHDSWYGGTTSGWQSGTKPGAWRLAHGVYEALKYGKVELFCYWVLSSTNSWDEGYSLIWNGSKTKEYYVMKNFARYIRPGAIQLGSASDDEYIHELVYRHPADQTVTVVLLNTSTQSRTVSVTGVGLPSQLQAHRSSAGENCASLGSVSAQSIQLPGETITTLVGAGYDPPVVGVATREFLRPVHKVSGSGSRILRLDGRVSSLLQSHRRPAARGVYVIDGDGARTVMGGREDE